MKDRHQWWCKMRRRQWLIFLYVAVSIVTIFVLLWKYFPDRPFGLGVIREPTVQLYRQLSQSTTQGGLKASLPLQLVNGTQTRLLSAYLESREHDKKVRVIAVVLRSEPRTYHCTLRCQKHHYKSIGQADIHIDHFGFNYGTADILCPVPSGCDTPSHVAVKSPITVDENTNEQFLEVFNHRAQGHTFPHNFTVCFTAMFNFTNVLQLVQNMEMLQLLGVSKVVVYKTSCSADIQLILDYYTLRGMMEVITWEISKFLKVSSSFMPNLGPGDLHYYGQIPVLTDCLYRNMYQTKYLALHDLDELIIPRLQNSLDELLPVLEQRHGSAQCYFFQNCVFRTSVKLLPSAALKTPKQPKGMWQDITGVNILDHLYHEPFDPLIQKFKTIVNPRLVTTLTVHGVLKSNTKCAVVNTDEARLHHTRPPVFTQFRDDQLIYDDRILHYSALLTPAVNAVLQQVGPQLPDSR